MTARRRILVAYSAASAHVATTRDYLESLSRRLPGAEVRYVHVTSGAVLDFDMNAFDALFHSYCARLPVPGYLSESYLAQARRFRGPKIASLQDEYERPDLAREAMKRIGFDAVLTCTPPNVAERIYPKADFPDTEFVRVLTGYAPENAGALARFAKPLADRDIVVGYRGRDLGSRYGRLAFDKVEIGRKVRSACELRGLSCDIEWEEGARFYGDEWWAFLGSCLATLGTESGSNVFDFNGEVERRFAEMSAALRRAPTHEEFGPVAARFEEGVAMGQISPRLFEAAALRTPMILLRGSYSGVLQPDEHYIPLERDYSNLDAVLTRLGNIEELESLAGRAYDRLIGSGRYAYQEFANIVSALIEKKIGELKVRPRPINEAGPPPSAAGADPLLIERPTRAIADAHSFTAAQARREAKYYLGQIELLNLEIARLNDIIRRPHIHLARKLLRRDH